MSKVSSSKLILYKRNGSPPSSAVRMLGDMLGLTFECIESDIIKMEHRTPEFVKINPMATVPVLQDGDLTICESHAILIYLLSKYGEDKLEQLYPSDLSTRANINQMMFFDTGVLFMRIRDVGLPTLLQGLKGPSEQHIEDIDEAYSVIEAYLKKHLYVATDHLTIADLSLGATTLAMQVIHKLDKNRFPLSAEWLERLKGEESFKKINEPSVAVFSKILNSLWQKNNAAK